MNHPLLAYMALLCTSVLASHLRAEEQIGEAEAAKKIELLGGEIERDKTIPEQPVVGIRFVHRARFNDKYAHLLKSFERLKILDVAGSQATNAAVANIAQVTSLEELIISSVELQKSDFEQFAKLKQLKSLLLWTPFGIHAIDEIRRKEIEESLPGVRVTCGGFKGRLQAAIPIGYEIEYLSDQPTKAKFRYQKLAADGTVESPQLTTFGRPGLQMALIDRELTVNEKTTIKIPEDALEVSIIDARGNISIVVDEKTMTRFKAESPPVLEKK